MKRLVGIDYGRRRLGVAVTDPLGITVQGRDTIVASGFDDAVRQTADVAAAEDASAIVIGLPLNMDGSRGEMAGEAERFGMALSERSGRPVAYWDERLTSEQARRSLPEGKAREKGRVDRVAAVLMLESYIQAHPIA